MTLLKMVRQTLFRTIALSVGTTSMGFHSCGEREGSTANTAWGKWEFIAKEQGSNGQKTTNRKLQG